MKQPVGDTAYMTEHMRYLLRLLDDPPIHLASTPLGAHRGEGGYPPQKETSYCFQPQLLNIQANVYLQMRNK